VLDSSIIKISLDHEDPEMAARALNLLVEKFKEKHLEVFSEQKTDFVQAQLRSEEASLARAESDLAEFKLRAGLHDLLEQKKLVINERVKQESDLRDTDLKIAELKSAMNSLKVSEGITKVILPASVIADQRATLASRRRDLYTLKSNYELKTAELEE